MKRRCSNCGWLEVGPSSAMFCGYSDERTWENESCLAWKDKDEPKTNIDRVHAMNAEELAEWYWWMLRYVQGYTDSRVALLDWLKQETTTQGEMENDYDF